MPSEASALGWANEERAAFIQRAGTADLVMALALVHHLSIANNLPLGHVARFLIEQRAGKPMKSASLLAQLLAKVAKHWVRAEPAVVDQINRLCESGYNEVVLTASLAFGPPYKPVVKAYPAGSTTARLSMSLVGMGGESCSNLMVGGKRQ